MARRPKPAAPDLFAPPVVERAAFTRQDVEDAYGGASMPDISALPGPSRHIAPVIPAYVPYLAPPYVRSIQDPSVGFAPGTLPASWSDGRFDPPPGHVCRCCGLGSYTRAGTGWCCTTCH